MAYRLAIDPTRNGFTPYRYYLLLIDDSPPLSVSDWDPISYHGVLQD